MHHHDQIICSHEILVSRDIPIGNVLVERGCARKNAALKEDGRNHEMDWG